MGCSWFNTETNKKKTSINNKKSPVMRPNLQPKIYKSPVVAQQLYHMYATTRYNFACLKATHKICPLEELVGGRGSPPQQFPEVNRYGLQVCILLKSKCYKSMPECRSTDIYVLKLFCMLYSNKSLSNEEFLFVAH